MVIFQEDGHKYFNIHNGKDYVSATTLIGKYKPPFDKDFWSKYKAIEKYITETASVSEWLRYKKVQGYKRVVKVFYDNASSKKIEIVEELQKKILQEWEEEKEIACFNGTNFHKARELGWLSKKEHNIKGTNHKLGEAFSSATSKDSNGNVIRLPFNLPDLKDGVYTELTLWNNYYNVAGQADIVIIETLDGVRYVDIDDYKTNKEIKEKSYKNPKGYVKMLHPLTSVMDCNYCHYNLQVSLYAYLLELAGFTPRNLEFQHWKNVGSKANPSYEKNKEYIMEYLKDDVIRMLTHYKKSQTRLSLNEFKHAC